MVNYEQWGRVHSEVNLNRAGRAEEEQGLLSTGAARAAAWGVSVHATLGELEVVWTW